MSKQSVGRAPEPDHAPGAGVRAADAAPFTFVGSDERGSHNFVAALSDNACLATEEWCEHIGGVPAASQLGDSGSVIACSDAQVPNGVALDVRRQLDALLHTHRRHASTEAEC